MSLLYEVNIAQLLAFWVAEWSLLCSCWDLYTQNHNWKEIYDMRNLWIEETRERLKNHFFQLFFMKFINFVLKSVIFINAPDYFQ